MIASPISRRKPTNARIEHRERMHAAILRAARELIASQGIDGLTMRKLGNRVGVTAATLYGYFPSRETVLQALLEEKLAVMTAMIEETAEGSAPGVARLLAFARGYREFAKAYPDFYDMYICNLEPPRWGALESDTDARNAILVEFHRELRESMERGEMHVADIDTVLRLMWSAAHGYISLEKTNCFGTVFGSPEASEAAYMDHMATLMQGFLTPAGVTRLDQVRSGQHG
jgi:AcrR family transcriptional regulator